MCCSVLPWPLEDVNSTYILHMYIHSSTCNNSVPLTLNIVKQVHREGDLSLKKSPGVNQKEPWSERDTQIEKERERATESDGQENFSKEFPCRFSKNDICICIHVNVHEWKYMYAGCIHIYIYMYTYLYIYTYLYR